MGERNGLVSESWSQKGLVGRDIPPIKCSGDVINAVTRSHFDVEIALGIDLKTALDIALGIALETALGIDLETALDIALGIDLETALDIALETALGIVLDIALETGCGCLYFDLSLVTECAFYIPSPVTDNMHRKDSEYV